MWSKHLLIMLRFFLLPAPCSYTLPGMSDLVMRKIKQKELGFKAPFDSSRERITMTAEQKMHGAEPPTFQPNVTEFKPVTKPIVSGFRDKSKRDRPDRIDVSCGYSGQFYQMRLIHPIIYC